MHLSRSLVRQLVNTQGCGTLLRYFSTTVKMQLDISGIYPPIATPFNSDESIAYDKLAQNIEKWNKIPLRGESKIVFE